VPALQSTKWGLVVLDEAQAIKNPSAKQTRAVKALASRGRLALTGTPVENRLGDLWSLFDFLQPGLLGSAKEFGEFTKARASSSSPDWGPLRRLVRPFILRRLKTDRSVIADLPEKTEMKVFCHLSKAQAILYQQAVDELAKLLGAVDGMKRRGVVLSYLMRFKQLCNHPSQWLRDGRFDPKESGKLTRLAVLGEEIASRQEKVLVFTQFQEMTEPLHSFLAGVFGRPGLVLHGGTPVAKRRALVDEFQREDGPPFFVVSVKAGGTGLNLTEASHVVHFDRWWNPAVEDQATDRAFRIGQKRNVLVHKLVCRGTVEERIDALIEAKKALARDVLEGGAEARLTEMSDDELLRLVSLDLAAATAE
jgi:non-specific serine/threonine protein kinase